MSEAKNKYKKCDPWKENNREIFINYIEELEEINNEMLEFLLSEHKIALSPPVNIGSSLRLERIIEKATGLPIEEVLK